jgi:hypothetical protein
MAVAVGELPGGEPMDCLNVEATATPASGTGTESMRAIEIVPAPRRRSAKITSAGSGATRRTARRVALAMIACGVLLALGAVYAQLARALPLNDLLRHSRVLPATILLGAGTLLMIAAKRRREPTPEPQLGGTTRNLPAVRLRESASGRIPVPFARQ